MRILIITFILFFISCDKNIPEYPKQIIFEISSGTEYGITILDEFKKIKYGQYGRVKIDTCLKTEKNIVKFDTLYISCANYNNQYSEIKIFLNNEMIHVIAENNELSTIKLGL